MSKGYDFASIEERWQVYWGKNNTFRAIDSDSRPKYYLLDMFPYPSGTGLHVGHSENYTASDVLGRFKKAQGFNILHPMGWDAFGLPAEQHAMATGLHPSVNTQNNIEVFRRQIKRHGFGLDWDREINTTDPSYYRWTQWIFLQLFKYGLAYVDEKPVWWCPQLGTVLANEEVVDGRSERGEYPVERRNLLQWVLKISTYADKLLEGLTDLDWPSATKRQQNLWIGRSEGAEVLFKIEGKDFSLKIFTTRLDTLFGVTYLAVAPEHERGDDLTVPDQKSLVEDYRLKSRTKSDLDRTDLAKEKTGVFTGSYALHPLTGQRLPVWMVDYVLPHYGTGAIMGVPAHDERDFEFATAMSLPVVPVIEALDGHTKLPYGDEGTLIHSGRYSGLSSAQAKTILISELAKLGMGTSKVHYKLHDWLFSRQRYWGEPFPIVWVKEEDYRRISSFPESPFREFLPSSPVIYIRERTTWCAIPLTSNHLPVELPTVSSFKPDGESVSPLHNASSDWKNVALNLQTGILQPSVLPREKEEEWITGTRELNTKPQWAGSCWYHLRYLSPHCSYRWVDGACERYWGTPDFYIGGNEHAVLHLLYARFWHRFLYDIGLVGEKEPFKKLFHQGVILGADGNKMSKSHDNVVNPEEIIDKYGADTLRLYTLFLGPLEATKPWNSQNIEGVHRFLKKVWREYVGPNGLLSEKIKFHANDEDLDYLLHQTIFKVTEDIENLRFNTAISQLMIGLNGMQKAKILSHRTAKTFLQLLAPFAPHIAEELWAKFDEVRSVSEIPWPTFDPRKLECETVVVAVQVNGKVRGELRIPSDASQETVFNLAKELPRIMSYLAQGKIVKEIYVPRRLVNFVVR
ncbi:MAG: leucine--tRNA ligase [Puniceicoccales bacterium]|jgi:leucyl-tRNA synthetase|nr:leucine--tRNA ligase [Puniceicoccales bacterium]